MKLRKGWEITTKPGDVFVVTNESKYAGTLKWAKRHGYSCKRVFILN